MGDISTLRHFLYSTEGLANSYRAELERQMTTRTDALVSFLEVIDPDIYPILRPFLGLVVLVILNHTNLLSNTNTGHHTAELMNRFLLPLFEGSVLQTDDYYSMYVGRLCAILDSFIGRGYRLTPVEISSVKNYCLKLEQALKAYPKHLPEYTKDRQTSELALHNVKHNILLPSASTPASPPEGSPMSTEVARVVVKQRPAEVRAFLVQRLAAIESFRFTTMEDVEELITMSGNARHTEYSYYHNDIIRECLISIMNYYNCIPRRIIQKFKYFFLLEGKIKKIFYNICLGFFSHHV